MRQELLAAREWAHVYTEGGKRYRITARAELVRYDGNDAPHFSITGEVVYLARNGRKVEHSGGAIHEQILRYFPQTEPLVRIHLSDDDGVPLHAYANAGYWAGHTKWNYLDLPQLAKHLRVSETEAREMLDYIAHYWGELDNVTTPEQAWRDACAVHGLPYRWKAEANQALALLNRVKQEV
jgi:hypothetical protein